MSCAVCHCVWEHLNPRSLMSCMLPMYSAGRQPSLITCRNVAWHHTVSDSQFRVCRRILLYVKSLLRRNAYRSAVSTDLCFLSRQLGTSLHCDTTDMGYFSCHRYSRYLLHAVCCVFAYLQIFKRARLLIYCQWQSSLCSGPYVGIHQRPCSAPFEV